MSSHDAKTGQPYSTRRTRPSRRAVVFFVLIAAALTTVDLVTKSLAFDRVAGAPVALERDESGQLPPLPRHDSVVLVPRVLALQLTVNKGAVFGLGRGGRWLFVAFSLIAAGVILTVFSRSSPTSKVLHITLAAVLAGALGNLYDRLRFGVVRDMLLLFPDVKLPFGWHWPDGSGGLYPWIFNIADVCLVLGLIILMILMYRHDHRVAEETAIANRKRERP